MARRLTCAKCPYYSVRDGWCKIRAAWQSRFAVVCEWGWAAYMREYHRKYYHRKRKGL